MLLDRTSYSAAALNFLAPGTQTTANTSVATTNPLLKNSNAVTALTGAGATTNNANSAQSRIARINALVEDMSKTLTTLKASRTASRDVETMLKSLRSSLEETRTRMEDAKAASAFTVIDDTDSVAETDADTTATTSQTLSVAPVANKLAGTTNVTEETRLGDIAGFAGKTRFGLTLGDTGRRAETKIDENTTVGELAERLSGISGISASVENGKFTVTAKNGQALELRDNGSGILAGLGFTANQTRTVSVATNAALEATNAVDAQATVADLFDGTDGPSDISVNLGDQSTKISLAGTDTIEAVRARFDAVEGVKASLTDDGRLKLESETGDRLTLSDDDGATLEKLGFTPEITESVSQTVEVREGAITTGTTDIGSLWRLTNSGTIKTGDQFSIKAGDADPVTFTIQSSDTAASLVNRINADEGLAGKVEASLNDEGQLQIEAIGGGSLELDDVRGTVLAGLGFAQDSAKVVTTAAPVTTGTTDIQGLWRLSSSSSISNGDEFTIKVGDADAVSFTIQSGDTAQKLVDRINGSTELNGSVVASLTDSGSLRLESTNGEGLELDEVRGNVLSGLGFAQDTAKTVQTAAAITTGYTDIQSLWRLSYSAQISNGDQFSIKVGDNEAATFTIESSDTAQKLVDKINTSEALGGAVKASLTDDGALRLAVTTGESLELDDVRGTVLAGLGYVQDTVKQVATSNAVMTGTADLDSLWRLSNSSGIANGDQFSIRTGDNEAVTFTIESTDTAQKLVDKINTSAELAGSVKASLSDEGALRLEAVDGQRLELDNVRGTPLAGLGFSQDTVVTKTVDNASVIGTTDIASKSRLRYFSGINTNESFSVQAGNGEAQTFTITASMSAQSLVDEINANEALAGTVQASLTDDGALRLEATNGERLTLKNVNGNLLNDLGIATNANEFSGYDEADISGTTNLRDLGSIADLAGSQIGASFSVQIGDGAATEISVDAGTTGQDILDQINAIEGVTASFNSDGSLRIDGSGGQSLTLQNVSGDLLGDFGVDTQIQGVNNAVATGSKTLNLDTRLNQIDRKADNDELIISKGGQDYVLNTGYNKTVGDMIGMLNQIDGIAAELDDDGHLRIEATDGQAFSINKGDGDAPKVLGLSRTTYSPQTNSGATSDAIALYEGAAYTAIDAGAHEETYRVASADPGANSYNTLVHRADYGTVDETTYVHRADSGTTDEIVYVHKADERVSSREEVDESDSLSVQSETEEVTESFVGLAASTATSTSTATAANSTSTASESVESVATDGRAAARRIVNELTDKLAKYNRDGLGLLRGRSETVSVDESGTSTTVYGRDLTLEGMGLSTEFDLTTLEGIDKALASVESAITNAGDLKNEIDRKQGQVVARQGFAETLIDSLQENADAASALGDDFDPLAQAKKTGQMFLDLSMSLSGALSGQLRTI